VPFPMTPRSAKRWEQLYAEDEVTAEKQHAQALYEVRRAKSLAVDHPQQFTGWGCHLCTCMLMHAHACSTQPVVQLGAAAKWLLVLASKFASPQQRDQYWLRYG
jgi:hypothetical protein